MNGIFVTMMVMNWPFATSGRFAMQRTALPTCATSISGSTLTEPSAWGTPLPILAMDPLEWLARMADHSAPRQRGREARMVN